MSENPVFSRKELSILFLTVFCVSIAFFLVKWKKTDFSAVSGTSYFLQTLIAMTIFMVFMVFVQKRFAYSLGYVLEYDNTVIFLIIGTAITFLFQGYVFVIVPGMIALSKHSFRRIGHFRSDTNDKDIAVSVVMAAVAALGFYLIAIILYGITHVDFFLEISVYALAIGLFSLIPTPRNMGISIFKWSGLLLVVAMSVLFLVLLATSVLGQMQGFLLGAILGAFILFFMGLFDLLPRLKYGS